MSEDFESVFRQNKSPFANALGDWFPLRTYFLTSKASPNDSEIVIVVIIVIGEAEFVLHSDGIIAQTSPLNRAFSEINSGWIGHQKGKGLLRIPCSRDGMAVL